jgi:hypothetical protein
MVDATIARFDAKWSPEPFSGCHLWFGANNPAGYGRFGIRKIMHHAHRVAWLLHRGEIPSGVCVCHVCDTPSCVNPDHLFLGTHTDNERDKMNKGRKAVGEKIPWHKLSEGDVRNIRQDPRPQTVIASEFGVRQCLISAIKNRKCWRHVK